jgi:hypothetical protein
MTDIVERLKKWCHSPDHLATKDLLDEAALSIAYLRLEAEVHRSRAAAAVAEIARLRLTAEEREAIEYFVEIHNEGYGLFSKHTATLRKILERLK